MTPLSIAYVATAAICMVVALQHIVVAFRVPERRLHLLFALASLGVVGDALVARASSSADSARAYLALMPFGALSIVTAIIALSWFVTLRTGATRRWLVILVSTLAGLTVVLDFAVGIAYSGEVALQRMTLPWGEQITLAVGDTNPLRVIGDLTLFGFLLVLVDATIRLIRQARWREARIVGGSLVVYALGLFMIIPVDMGLLPLPSLHTFAFLLIVAAMSWDLSEDLIRTAQLSREVVANERRWRQLIEDVQLLAVRIDRDGKIVEVNPYFTQVMGYTTANAEGREYWEFVAPERRQERREAFERAIAGDPTLEVQVETTSKDGEQKTILWRNVVLRDAEGLFEGMLSLGADITGRLAAEAERDCAVADLERTVAQLENMRARLEEENIQLREEVGRREGHHEIIGSSDAMLYVLHKIDEVAGKEATVLVQGETGVGKELVARAIHRGSERSARPFIAVNCAGLTTSLIESELFGHEKGAFTGADSSRRGRFELADGGTLFLDEVGELPLEVQPKLLRVLQEGEIERVGGQRTISVDVRLIAATNRTLRDEVAAGRFREDLFYRLEVYPITVPPLRDRSSDIPNLVAHFADRFGEIHGARVEEIPADLMRKLESYQWPGNVRELQNVVERAVLACNDEVLRLAEPLEALLTQTSSVAEATNEPRLSTLEEVERTHITKVLAACNGKISGRGGAAQVLGMHPNTLRSRIKKLGLGGNEASRLIACERRKAK